VRQSKNRGFTLIELLLVIVIIATLAALVIPNFVGRGEEARRAAAKTQIGNFESALDAYELDNGAYPTTAQGLEALRTEPSPKPKSWKGPYLKKEIPNDPWGAAFNYKAPGQHHPTGADIWSNGPDGREGTEDDVNNWDVNNKETKK
jgi:general secretion pathway protein G